MNKITMTASLGLISVLLLGGCARLDVVSKVVDAANDSVDAAVELETQTDLETMMGAVVFTQATPSYAVDEDDTTLTDSEKIDLAQSLFLAVHLVHSSLAIKKLEIKLEADVLSRVARVFQEAELTLSEEDITYMDTYLTAIRNLKTSISTKAIAARNLIRGLRGHVTLANIDVVISTLQEVQDLQVEIRDLAVTLLENVISASDLLLNYFSDETLPITNADFSTIEDIKVIFGELTAIRAELLNTNSDVKEAIRALRVSLNTFNVAGLTLTQPDRVTLGISKLALHDTYDHLEAEMQNVRGLLDGLQGKMNLDNLDLIKTTFTSVVALLTDRQIELQEVITSVTEAKLIIDSYL